MRFSKLNPRGTRSFISQSACPSIVLGILLFLTASGLSQKALAQSIQPVARLLSERAAAASYSRPRRVKSDESPVNTADSVAAGSSALESASAIERRAFDQTNLARLEKGLPALVWDPELCRMARAHSERMALLGYLSHETPEGLQLKDRAHENGVLHFRVIGENIAYNKGFDDPGGFAVERWMTSAGHRANILYPAFQASAIGSYVSADGSTYLTQVFIAR